MIAMEVPVPDSKPVRDLLLDLMGREVDVTLAAPYDDVMSKNTYAVYVDDSLRVRAVVVADLRFSGYAGGAIGLIPPGGVQDQVDERSLGTSLEDNFHEVLNILASLFNVDGAPHMKLYAVHGTNVTPPQDVVAMSQVLGRRLDLEISIAGYGKGRFSIVVVA